MELLNLPISKTPQLFSCFFSSFTPRLSIKTSKKKPLRGFDISKFHKVPSCPCCIQLPLAKFSHVSARFGGPTSRRNSLRKKLLLDQKVRENLVALSPTPDFQNPNDGFENIEKLNSASVEQSEVDADVCELKTKRLGESVLLSKLETWVDQYKKDAEFWGIGSGPIFTVSQDLEGNVKEVTINEDEILKRLELEDLVKVNSKVLYAKSLAREMERGENVIPRNSSVAKFVVAGEESSLISGIRGVILRPGFMPQLSRVGSLLLCGFLVLWAVKKLFVLGKNEVAYTELEKEMMRRKMKARNERDMLERGSVEVVQVSAELPNVSFQRPKLDRQELMNNILKAKAAKNESALLDSSDAKSTKSMDYEVEIQEIKTMANNAREVEGREKSVVNKDEKEVQATNMGLSDEMLATKEDGWDGMSSPSNLSNEDSEEGKVSYRTADPKSPCEPKEYGVKSLNGVAFLDSRVRCINDASSTQLSEDKQSIEEDVKNIESIVPLNREVIQFPDIPDSESYTAKNTSLGKKPRVILSVKEARKFLSEKNSNEEQLKQEPQKKAAQNSVPDKMLPNDKNSYRSTKQILDLNGKIFQHPISSGESEFTPPESSCQSSIGGDTESVLGGENSDEECKEEVNNHPRRSSQPSTGISEEPGQSVKKKNWIENNFDDVEPVLKKIGDGFRENYVVAREKVAEQLNMNTDITQLGSTDESEFEWMKDDRLKEIVFQVRENELAGQDPFYLMDAEDKLAFFQGLEKKVEKENEKLTVLHEWLHSNIENLDYGADGISLHDPPEKIVPRWKGPPLEKSPEFLNNFQEQRKALFTGKAGAKRDEQSLPQKSEEHPNNEKLAVFSSELDLKRKYSDGGPKNSKVVVEGSDGSVKPGKKSGKEYWQHTKKWSRGFLESYNAETDPEVKSTMKDIGKDLDRWITEKEIQEAADLMTKLPERNKKFMEKKLNKIRREMELFGPQAVVSKYQEYAEDKEEDYLWWLDLPHVLCIELYTFENEQQRIGFYALEMASDLELEPKPHHVIAFEDAGDCKNFCYIVQAHLDMLGNGRAFIVPQPPKDAFREAKANGFGVTVIRKGELQLNVDQTLEEVEEQICEIGSKMYHDMIMRERSVDISSLMKGVLGASSKPPRRKRSKKKLKRHTKK